MFKETEHPRDNDGKFTSANGKNPQSDKLISAVKKYSDTPENDLKNLPRPKAKSVKNVEEPNDIKNKADLVSFIEHQTNIKLENDPNERWNDKRNTLYTQIPANKKNEVLSLLQKYGFPVSEHVHGYYWIGVKPQK